MSDVFLLVLDLGGIAVFAMTGALVGVRKELDGFGVAVLAIITGLGGGVLRDVLIGAVPPMALNDWRYLVVPTVTGIGVFYFHPMVGRVEKQIAVLDAIGLGLFCVTGAVKAEDFGLGIVPAALLGMVTAVGGGLMRDVLAGRVPVIFKDELYATPALAGALIAATLHYYEVQQGWYSVAVGVCIVWRLLAVKRGWQAPLPPGIDRG
ncbi:MAG: trimeric intracellular cation channel family protein [Kineosporiaceae bacterium]|nr:trimeric intracellular cation channel family protein [Aeromicrobium sp.]